MSDLIDNGWLSVCHDAPVRVVGGDEGTNHWECTKCGQSCNATKLDKKLIRKLCMDWLPALKSLAKK